jgi:hypothetical protein
MWIFLEKPKVCALCGKDISFEHMRLDEYGREVHLSCHAQKLLHEAAAQQLEVLRRAKQA